MGKKQTNTPTITAPARQNTPLLFLLLLVIPLYGGYYNFTVCLAGVTLAALLVYETMRRGGVLLPNGAVLWILLGLVACSGIAIPFAVSQGLAAVGFLRILVWLLFYLYAATYTPTERQNILDVVAYEGSVLCLFSVVGYVWDMATGVGNANGRIDGFFEYANTYGLFLLLCLILLLTRRCRKKIDYAAMAVLTLGIFLSGSRGIFLLLLPLGVFWAVGQVIKTRKLLPVALGFGGVLAAVAVATLASGGLVLRRIMAITLSSSSLNGRLLYYLDGLAMLWDNPLGVGRGGYQFLQPLYQSGVYTLKFIHNEYLQLALDGGIVAGVLLLALMGVLFFRRGASVRERAIVFAVGAHCMIDFDLQFTAIVFLLLLCGGFGREKLLTLPNRVPALVAGGVLALVMGYFSIGYTLDYLGNSKSAYAMLPWDLSLAENRLQNCSTMEEAVEIADAIIATTDLSMLAWDCKYTAAVGQGSALEMATTKYQYLRLNKYRGEVYDAFTTLLEHTDPAASQADIAVYKALATNTLAQLKEVTESTSPLAYRIFDKPQLDFAADITRRLQQIERGRIS